MASPDDWLYEYSIVRYVPKSERGEFLNIGLVMMNKRKKWLKGEIALDRDRILFFNPRVDFECLENQAKLFEQRDVPSPHLPVEEKYRWLTAMKSACLQVSPSHPGIIPPYQRDKEDATEILDAEFYRLFKELVL